MKEKKASRNRIIGLRLTLVEYDLIEKRFKNAAGGKLSDYVRRILMNRPVTVYQRNQSLDDFMAEMIQLRTELNGIGNNFNQAVKRLHTLRQIPEFKDWIITHELDRNLLLNKVDEIKNRINKIADEWLR